jgi:hypothetical protein
MSPDHAQWLIRLIVIILSVSFCLSLLVEIVSFSYGIFQENARDRCRYRLDSIQDRLFRLYIEHTDYYSDTHDFDGLDYRTIRKKIERLTQNISHISWKTNFLYKGNKEIDRRVVEWNRTWQRILDKYDGTPIKDELIEIDREIILQLTSVYCWNSPINTVWCWLAGKIKSFITVF